MQLDINTSVREDSSYFVRVLVLGLRRLIRCRVEEPFRQKLPDVGFRCRLSLDRPIRTDTLTTGICFLGPLFLLL